MELKFRAKANIDNEWKYASNIHKVILDNTNEELWVIHPKGEKIEHLGDGYIKYRPLVVDENTIDQFTGLKDIKDTELYINDIVKVDYDLMSKNDTGLRVIRFMEGALRLLEYDYFEDDNVAKWTDWQVLHQGFIKEEKIIKVGNIHENKELLK